MERIILLIDPSGIKRPALDFACSLTRLTGSQLTGLFLHGESPVIASEVALSSATGSASVAVTEKITLEHPLVSVEESKAEFSRFCLNHGLNRTPDMIDASTTDQVVIESRFADLLVVGADSSFYREPESVPTELVTHLLKHAECPLVIAPFSESTIDEIVFAYDGSASSVFAIKEFSHLFPQLQDKRVIFLEVNEDFSSEIEYRDKITDYLKMHYSSIGYQVLMGVPEDELYSYFLKKKNVIVVMGAFGKKPVLSLSQRSTAHLLLKTTSLPVFISHK